MYSYPRHANDLSMHQKYFITCYMLTKTKKTSPFIYFTKSQIVNHHKYDERSPTSRSVRRARLLASALRTITNTYTNTNNRIKHNPITKTQNKQNRPYGFRLYPKAPKPKPTLQTPQTSHIALTAMLKHQPTPPGIETPTETTRAPYFLQPKLKPTIKPLKPTITQHQQNLLKLFQSTKLTETTEKSETPTETPKN